MKNPPNSQEAEKAVLGSILLRNELLEECVLQADDFYYPQNATIFTHFKKLYYRKMAIDPITLNKSILEDGEDESSGGISYYTSLADEVVTTAHFDYYQKIVLNTAILRRLLVAGQEMIESIYSGKSDVSEIIQALNNRIESAESRETNIEDITVESAFSEALKLIDKRIKSEGKLTGLSTGYYDLDDRLGGLQSGDLIILAARPSMGKTALALNIAEKAALMKKRVLFVSLEMSKAQLATRLLSSQSRISQFDIRRGYLTDRQLAVITQKADRFSALPLFLDDSSALSIFELTARARRLARKLKGLDLLIVDYIQLMKPSNSRMSREQQISQMSRNLKHLARELNCPVIALSQLNRSLENRVDKKPKLSDLRESGAIEQDADVVLFLYRQGYYENTDDGLTNVIIAKHRNGPTGVIDLWFNLGLTKFENLEKNGALEDF